MPKYVIERDMPGVGALSPAELHTASAKSNAVLAELGGRVQWVQSYVTGDKIFCVYIAEDAELIHEHARGAGLPANAVRQVGTIIDPTTGE